MVIDRFINYMEYRGLNDNQVTVDCGLSVGLIGKARKGKNDLGRNTIEKILKRYRDLNRDWLLTGKGEMLNSETKEPNSNEEDMQMKELIAAFRENREMLAEALDQNSRLIGVIERMQGIDRSATGVQKSPPPRISHRNRVNFDCNKEYDKIIYY